MNDPRQHGEARRRPPALWVTAIFTLILLWPAIASGGALWFDDLSPYVRGGAAAVRAVFGEAAGPSAATGIAAASGSGLADGLAAPVSGVRSIVYSLTAYLAGLPLPRFWALAIFQAGIVAALLAAFVQREHGPLWLYAGVVAVSGAPIAASTASPDVWAGIMLLGILLLVRHAETLGWPMRAFAGGCVAFAVAAHPSHLLLGAALAAFVLAWPYLTGTKARGGALLLGGVALGVAGVVATSLIGFGEASLAPKRYPIVLARAIEDGPALWHLEDHCDEYRYAVCEVFPGDIPDNVGSFLWNDGGLRDLATPEQMDRVRAEETLIVRRALAEYPFHQVRQAGTNFARQAAMIAEAPRIGRFAARDGTSDARRGGSVRAPRAGRLLVLVQMLTFVSIVAVLSGLAVLRYVRLGPANARFLAIAAAGFLTNAAICGVLSVPAARYQARIAWVIPIVGVALLCAPRNHSPREHASTRTREDVSAV